MKHQLKKQVENLLKKYPRVFFCHVPKCGGVSLTDAIYRSLYPKILKASRFANHIDLKGSKVASDLLNIDMMTVRESQLINFLASENQVYITGHCRARPEVTTKFSKDWSFITILREPDKRFVSEYIYNRFKESSWLKGDIEISEYLNSDKAKLSCTTYARFFSKFNDPNDILTSKAEAIDSAIENLKNFASVGVLENLETWKNQFNQHFNVEIKINNKNTTPNSDEARKVFGNSAIMEKIHELNEVDREIYSYFLNR